MPKSHDKDSKGSDKDATFVSKMKNLQSSGAAAAASPAADITPENSLAKEPVSGANKTADFKTVGELLAEAKANPGGTAEKKSGVIVTHPSGETKSYGGGYGDGYGSAYHGGGYYGGTGSSPNTGNPGSSVASSVTKSWEKKPVGVLAAVHPGGEIAGRWIIEHSDADWWDLGKEYYPVDETGNMLVPIDACKLTYETPTFNACTFTASEDYLAARWGRKLHFSDKEWLALHPFATDGGIPFEYTATALQQLVEPYGLRVSRIRVRKGALASGPEHAKWSMALGCNPFAMVDHSTSNKEAAEKLGISLEEANKLWRYEFSDEPLFPSVIGEKGWSSSTGGVQTGSFGGHARYMPPRGRPNDWAVSLQMDQEDKVQYLADPELPEYVPRKGKAKLKLGDVVRPDGKPVGVLVGAWYLAPEEAEVKKEADKSKWNPNKPTGTGFSPGGSSHSGNAGGSPSTGSGAGGKADGGAAGSSASSSSSSGSSGSSGSTGGWHDGAPVGGPEKNSLGAPGQLGLGLSAPSTTTPAATVSGRHGLPRTGGSATGGRSSGSSSIGTTRTIGSISDDDEKDWKADNRAVRSHSSGRETWVKCMVCDEHTRDIDLEPGTEVCYWCWGRVWAGMGCKSCGTIFTAHRCPGVIYRDSSIGHTVFECPTKGCDQEFELYDDQHEKYPELCELATWCEDSVDFGFEEDDSPTAKAQAAIEAAEAEEDEAHLDGKTQAESDMEWGDDLDGLSDDEIEALGMEGGFSVGASLEDVEAEVEEQDADNAAWASEFDILEETLLIPAGKQFKLEANRNMPETRAVTALSPEAKALSEEGARRAAALADAIRAHTEGVLEPARDPAPETGDLVVGRPVDSASSAMATLDEAGPVVDYSTD